MEILMRSPWLRRSGTFWASIALILMAFFSWATPSTAALNSGRRQSYQQNKVTNVVSRTRTKRYKVARTGRWIEVDLSGQRLYAWEGGRRVYSMRISSGKRSTPTRVGTYAIQRKYLAKTMRGRGYVAPNVPYTMYYSGGYAIHGAYWHNRFGTPVSHGCINLPVSQARRLYSWAGTGTRVVVHQ